jgi:DNA adenine methylase
MQVPFLKWAGGKRWLVNSNTLPVPKKFNTYFEPFLGSGAVFFLLEPQRAYLSDINPDLIELYRVIRSQPKIFAELLLTHHKKHSKEYYYKIRNSIPSNKLERAARFLYLNRTCWNGLYRVNLKGAFNVPIGTKTSVILETDDFVSISRLLKKATIICKDFEEIINITEEGDFLFIDPPYTVQHYTNNFLKYNEKIFSWDDQIRLREALVKAKMRGVQLVVTNADHPSIKELYKTVGKYHQFTRNSILAGDSSKRGPTTEAIFVTNIVM